MTSTATLTLISTASFVAAFVVTSIALVYVLRAPHIIIQDAALADEYYYVNASNAVSTLSGDLLGSALLLMSAQYIIYARNISSSLARIGVVAALVALVTIMRHASATESDSESNAGSWYARADIKNAIAYDIIYMVTLYIVMTAIFSRFV
jgi:hypothetical protein